jgi:glycosyltransferase involved in cell wall biosynthesis
VSRARVAYLVSKFPKLSETFVLFELLEIERQGVPVELYALQRERTPHVHAEAVPVVERAHFLPLLSAAILRDHLYFLRRHPGRYLRALRDLLRGNLRSPRYLAGAVAFFPKVVSFARRMLEDETTHLHAHFASHPAAAAFVIHRLTDIPYSFTAHGSDLHRDRTMLREKVREASAVVTISQFNRRIIVDECGPEADSKTRVVHCGIDPETFAPCCCAEAASRSLAGHAPLRIVCTGTLHEVKGQTHLLEACAKLRERGRDPRCEFIGGGPDLEDLRAQAEALGIDDLVHFHGSLPRHEVVNTLHHADVLVAPSVPSRDGRREGIPVALMEGMATGCAVVASRLSGIPELVEDERDGLLVEPGNASELADALERLDRSPALREQLGRAARDKVLSEFNLVKSAATLRQLFEPEATP